MSPPNGEKNNFSGHRVCSQGQLGALILATSIGAVGFDATVMVGVLAAIIGGTVVCGSNTSTLKQTMNAMKAAEAHRAELISRLELRVVGEGEVGFR